jgi:hypothetical protein
MLLRRLTHRYDRTKYPKSKLPGPAVCMFEAEVSFSVVPTVHDVATVRSPHVGATVRAINRSEEQ